MVRVPMLTRFRQLCLDLSVADVENLHGVTEGPSSGDVGDDFGLLCKIDLHVELGSQHLHFELWWQCIGSIGKIFSTVPHKNDHDYVILITIMLAINLYKVVNKLWNIFKYL